MSDVPSSWVMANLGDLTSKIGSGATPKGGHEAYHSQGVPLIRSMNVHFSGFKREGLAFLDAYQASKLDGVTVQRSDVLLNITGASIGRVTLAPEDMAGARVNQHVAIVRPLPGVDPTFLARFLASPEMQERINDTESGATRQALTKDKIENFLVPIPPLPEQKRIADKLERILARVDAARARLERVPELLKRFRTSVLERAVSGELTREWRSDTQENLGYRTLPVEWTTERFENLISHIRGGSTAVPIDGVTEYPILRSSSVRAGVVDFSDVRYLKTEDGEQEKSVLSEGDLLFTRLNGSIEYVANCAVVTNLNNIRYLYPDRLFCAKLKISVHPKYCSIAFNSSLVRKNIEEIAKSSAGHQRISISDIKNQEIPVPPLPEQAEIIRRVEQLFALADQLEARHTQARAALEHLTPALLAKAFRGELVEQDPNDEPARVLLERIRAERAAEGSAKKSGPGRKPRAARAQEGEAKPEGKRRGRPPKVRPEEAAAEVRSGGPARAIPQVSSVEEGLRVLEARKAEREAVGSVQKGLFE